MNPCTISNRADAPAGHPDNLLLVFGPKKLGELGKGLGEGIRGFREAVKGDPVPPATNERAVKDNKG